MHINKNAQLSIQMILKTLSIPSHEGRWQGRNGYNYFNKSIFFHLYNELLQIDFHMIYFISLHMVIKNEKKSFNSIINLHNK